LCCCGGAWGAAKIIEGRMVDFTIESLASGLLVVAKLIFLKGARVCALGATPGNDAVERKQYDCADDREDELREEARASESAVIVSNAENASGDKAADYRSRDAEQNRDDETARIIARHDNFGDDARYQSEDDP
jgi:hypothetical protein